MIEYDYFSVGAFLPEGRVVQFGRERDCPLQRVLLLALLPSIMYKLMEVNKRRCPARKKIAITDKILKLTCIRRMIYWVTQKLQQIYTAKHATFPIRIWKITVQICGHIWVTQYRYIDVYVVQKYNLTICCCS